MQLDTLPSRPARRWHRHPRPKVASPAKLKALGTAAPLPRRLPAAGAGGSLVCDVSTEEEEKTQGTLARVMEVFT